MVTLKQFLKENNGSPIDMEELAERLQDVETNDAQLDHLIYLAESYRIACSDFRKKLDEIGFEFG